MVAYAMEHGINYYDTAYIYHMGESEKVMGKILEQEEGEWWFWYDPIFYCDELGKSFWIATAEEKNSVSHRARAIQNLLEQEKRIVKKIKREPFNFYY